MASSISGVSIPHRMAKAFAGGMGFAGRNMYNLYYDGEEGVMEPDKAKADGSWRPSS